MTYGENSQNMRDSMVSLLQWHRIQQRLGGPGSYNVPVTTTCAERERMGQIVQRYRLAALTWCDEAVTAVTLTGQLSEATKAERSPEQELRRRLRSATAALGHGERLGDLLATHHGNDLLETWQSLARAAALGEHDFAAGVNRNKLTPDQARTVLKDAADLTRGLVILDNRYKNVPGWQHLNQPTRLDRAAECVSLTADQGGRDLTVDTRGWRSPAGLITGPVQPGVAGAVQAQHNTLVHLGEFPNALNLRRVLHSQARVSHEAARHTAIAAPDLFQGFAQRANLYHDLVAASRNLGGLAGGGGRAVVDSQVAAARLQRERPMPQGPGDPLLDLRRIFVRTDARIAATIERGVLEKLYLVAVSNGRLNEEPVNGFHPAQQHWIAVTSQVQAPLLALVREQLRPSAALPPRGPVASEIGRHAYASALRHAPQLQRGPTP